MALKTCAGAQHRAPLTAVTLSGVDDTTDQLWLWKLGALHPLVEWGVLYSNDLHGCGRYPSLAWIDSLAERIGSSAAPRFLIQLEGMSVCNLLDGDSHMLERIIPFQRVLLDTYFVQAEVSLLKDLMLQFPDKQFITSHNARNEWLYAQLLDCPNHQLLVHTPHPADLSVPARTIGWTGDIGPANLASRLPALQAATRGKACWVSIQEHLRDNADRFHLGLARLALRAAEAALGGTVASALSAGVGRPGGARYDFGNEVA